MSDTAPEGTTPPDQIFRARSRERAYLIGSGLCVAIALMWVITAAFMSSVPTRLVLTAVFLVLGGILYYWSRASVVVSTDRRQVVVRNPLRTATVAWSDIARFDVDSHYTGPTGTLSSAVLLCRRDGSSVRCAGVTVMSGRRTSMSMAGQLNRVLGLIPKPGQLSPRAQERLADAQGFAARLGKTPQDLSEAEWELFKREDEDNRGDEPK